MMKKNISSGENSVPQINEANPAYSKMSKSLKAGKKTKEENKQFPIVGIGASAGGLEALEQFLVNLPANNGMAIVIVQHLDPNRKGIMQELLQRKTSMKVFRVTDSQKVRPNCIYVIPQNKSMSILKGVLHLFEPEETRGLRLPIDVFFRSIADDLKERSIGIILSGMGSDGTLGMLAIKEKGGTVLVQEPASAKFDSMPKSAIGAMQVDIVAPPNELPGKLISYLRHIPLIISGQDFNIKDKSSLEKIIIILRSNTGHDFSLYKKNTLYRRIERRIGIHQINSISTYVQFLQRNPKEVEILFKELLIGVTGFFRDNLVWEYLKKKILPSLFAKLPQGYIFRVWVPGCSTGEEAYSLAIIFKEMLGQLKSYKNFTFQIFATDIDNDAIEKARKGFFPANIIADVSSDRRKNFFFKSDDGFHIKSEIRDMVVFAPQNVIKDPPFTKMNFISCRNMLIYMEPELQKKILTLFHFSLVEGGIMMLGSSESIGTQSYQFKSIDSKLKLYRRIASKIPPDAIDFPADFLRTNSIADLKNAPAILSENIQTLADKIIFQQFAPAGVLVNDRGDIIYISGRTGKYLEPAAGKANMNIFFMAREGLRKVLSTAFRRALRYDKAEYLRNVRVRNNGGSQTINVTVQKLEKPESLSGMVLIVFTDVQEITKAKFSKADREVSSSGKIQKQFEEELQTAYEELQSTREEMQTSQEELKSSNEELQSTNEELQSTNEELTTSKEEMQSMNEELQTVNIELQSKVDEYGRVNNDMRNLLNSTNIATLFLDKDLNIRRYTNEATKIFKLIKSDIGRPFTDISSNLEYPELPEDTKEVIRTLVYLEKEIKTRDAVWFNIRIMPYRTLEDRIEGLVLTFTDITKAKNLEAKLNETISILHSHNLIK